MSDKSSRGKSCAPPNTNKEGDVEEDTPLVWCTSEPHDSIVAFVLNILVLALITFLKNKNKKRLVRILIERKI